MTRDVAKAIAMTAPLDAEADVLVYRFYWLKRLAVVGMLGTIALWVSWHSWYARQDRRLAVEEKKWRDDHLTLVMGELYPPAVPDDQNAVVPLLAAVRAFEFDDAFDGLTRTSSFNADDPTTWKAGERKIVEGMLARNAPMMALARQAVTRPLVWWPRQRETGAGESVRSNLRSIGYAVKMHAELAYLEGDEEAFLDDLRLLYTVRRAMVNDLASPYWYMGTYAISLTCPLLMRHAPALMFDGPHGPEARREAQLLLAEWLSDPSPQEQMERVLEFQAAQDLERARSAKLLSDDPRAKDWMRSLAWRVLRPVAMRAMVDVLAGQKGDLDYLRSKPGTGTKLWNGLAPSRRPMTLEPAESIMEGFWPEQKIVATLQPMDIDAALSSRMACLVLACRLYSFDHGGRAPRDLSQLAPVYMAAVPVDPFDPRKGPLRYTTATTKPFLYSVGRVGRDLIAAGRYVPKETTAWQGPNPGAFIGKYRPEGQSK